jgi:phage terminase large subunit
MKHHDNLRVLAAAVEDPVRFARKVLGEDLWSVQEEILRSVATYPQTAVKACHSSGKTRVAAAAVLWWLAKFPDGMVLTLAPTWEQTEKVLWGEVHRLLRLSRLNWPSANRTELRLGPNNFAIGLSPSVGINLQGYHSEHLLIVIDEAPGIDGQLWESIEGVRASGAVHLLMLGNPTEAAGPFYAAFTSERAFWRTFTIDAFDTPNFNQLTLEQLRALGPGLDESAEVFQSLSRPYLVSRWWVYEKLWTWGEASPAWQARVLGQFPLQGEDALFSLAWLEAAKKRALPPDAGLPLQVGIDVAGPGDAETVVVIRSGPAIVAQQTWSKRDPRGEVVAFLEPYRARIDEINIDSVGIGQYFASHFEDLDYNVKFVNVGEAARDSEHFVNLKAELYWGLRQRLEAGDVAGLTDEVAISQLASIRYHHNARGQVVIESKDDLRKRGVKSPDRAEALMLAFADLTPGIIRYYEARVRELDHEAAPFNNPAVPRFEEDDDDDGDLMQVYEQERRRLQMRGR